MTNYVGATNNRSAVAGDTTIDDSFTHTFSSASGRVAVVLLFFGDQAGQSAASVTVGGNAATFLAAGASTGSTGHRAEIWYYAIPDGQLTGSQTIAVTLNSSAGYEWWQTCVELSDCSGPRAGSEVNEGGNTCPNPQTVTVTSATGDIVIDAIAVNGTTLGTAGGSQTSIRGTNTSDVQCASYAAGAATVDMSWSGFAASDYGHVAASFQTASGGATPTITDAGDGTFTNGETGIVITGTNFGASQGSGGVKISPTDDVDDAGAIAQTVTAWGATSVTITAVRSTLPLNTTCYLFVTADGDYTNASGLPVSFYTVGDTYRRFGPQDAQRVMLTL